MAVLALLWALGPTARPAHAEEPACYECHDALPAVSHPHDPVAEGDCTACHEDHGDEEKLMLVEEGSALCYQCHDDLGGKATMHPPVDDGECTSCHNPHGSDNAVLLVAPAEEICFECHDAPEGAVVHAAVEDGCTTCHDPHSSDNGALLTAPAEEICFECHDAPEGAVVHAAVEDGCTTCHTPHSSEHSSLLLAPAGEVCFECHDNPAVDDSGEEWGTPHPALDDGCPSCHSPHASEYDSLLLDSMGGVCGACHDDMKVNGEGNPWAFPHPPVDDDECGSCHQPHGGDRSALLKAAVPELCYECHEDVSVDEFSQPWVYGHPPVREEECLSCHAPHGSSNSGMLTGTSLATCGECHTTSSHDHAINIEAASGSIVIPEDFPRASATMLSCVGCHVPHGSNVEMFLRGGMGDFCIICHKY